jgi:hypothetical protein
MKNRDTFTYFTEFDDGQIELLLDDKKNVIVYVAGKNLVIHKKVGSIGTIFSFEDFPSDKQYSNKEFYSAFINQDTPDLESILNKLKEFLIKN